jgi:hypothetical protein
VRSGPRRALGQLLAGVVALWLLSAVPLGANPVLIGTWPGNERGDALAVTVAGQYAYVATGAAGLLIIDISDRGAPVVVGSHDTSDNAQSVAVSSGFAYVADGAAGLQVIDVSDPHAPLLVGSLDTDGVALDVAVVGSNLYLADAVPGLKVIDVSNPAAPVKIGSYSTTDYISDVVVAGSYAYIVADDAGFEILDISNPAAPQRIANYIPVADPVALAVAGNFAYLALEGLGLEVIDVANPSAPGRVAGLSSSGPQAVTVADTKLVLSDGEAGLKLIDVTNPAAPVQVGALPTEDVMFDAAIAGSHALVAEGDFGLRVVDITNPAPVRAGAFAIGESLGIVVNGQLAYVADGDAGLKILDLNDPANPRLLGALQTSDLAFRVAVSGAHAFVAADEAGLDVIDVSNPAAPKRVGGFQTGDYVSRVAVAGQHAFVVADDDGLVILDISTPAAPVLAGGYAIAADPLAVAVADRRAYITYADHRLVILDVTDPRQPAAIGSHATRGLPMDVAVLGKHAFLTIGGTSLDIESGATGLEVVDISNPAAPVRVSHYHVSEILSSVAVSGNYAYLTSGGGGLRVLDIRNPAAPVALPGIDTRGTSHHVAIAGDYACVADDDWGVAVIRVLPSSGERLRVSWPNSHAPLILETAPGINGPWRPSPAVVIDEAGQNHVTIYPADEGGVMRLQGGYGEATLLDQPISITDARDRGATLSSDGLTMIFFSNRSGQDDLYMATRAAPGGSWSEPTPLEAINTSTDEVFPSLSADGLALYFADRFALPSGRPGNLGGADLWVATRATQQSPWQAPVPLGPVVNGPFFDTSPSISSDGRTLLFASSDRPGNFQSDRGGRFDLWMTTREDPNAPSGWKPPVHLDGPINTSANESGPHLSRDGLTLFFASDRATPVHSFGPAGAGRVQTLNNIWVARRASTSEPFGPPSSLGVQFRYLHTMLDPHLAADGTTLYFATTGLFATPTPFADIWQAPVVPVAPVALTISRIVNAPPP